MPEDSSIRGPEDWSLRSPREIFAARGYVPLPPDEIDDQQLTGRLWELLYAAAGRRIYFIDTNHLGDRDFYTLLYEQWLNESTPDIPVEEMTNTRVLIPEFNALGMSPDQILLKYYADEETHELIRARGVEMNFPTPEDPPFDRDRFLPMPLAADDVDLDWLPEQDGDLDDSSEDADDEEAFGDCDEIDSEPGEFSEKEAEAVESQLEAQLRASEPENWVSPAEKLVSDNVPLLPPAEITDEMLAPILWELLHNLALRGFYILHSDHLSDRELYAELWTRGLREPSSLPGRGLAGGWFHDFLGSWSAEDFQMWLRYYASDEERAKYAEENPEDVIPPKEKPQANRDWRLPKGPFA